MLAKKIKNYNPLRLYDQKKKKVNLFIIYAFTILGTMSLCIQNSS